MKSKICFAVRIPGLLTNPDLAVNTLLLHLKYLQKHGGITFADIIIQGQFRPTPTAEG
jgi:hypothetical protein